MEVSLGNPSIVCIKGKKASIIHPSGNRTKLDGSYKYSSLIECVFLSSPILLSNFDFLVCNDCERRLLIPFNVVHLIKWTEVLFPVTGVFSCNQLTRSEYINGFGCQKNDFVCRNFII